ncbi:MAG: CCA tRNA nucleotidyltransferase [Armatimonadota bacterium]
MNPAINKIREAVKGTKYEGHLYLVGGIVRDKVMGRPHNEDVDIVYEGDALELARFLYKAKAADHHPVTYPRFGTAMISIGGRTVELVSARKESYVPLSRNPDVEPADLYDDVLRRDFTINTLLQNLDTGEILDLTGHGLSDIEAKIIRTPTDPTITFYDDPLRMLRAIRFAVRFGFIIEDRTYEAIVRNAERLVIISRERIRDEFVKIILSDKPSYGLRMLKESRLLEQFAPEFLDMQGVTQTGGHIWDVWEHTLHALESLPTSADLTLRLAVLFHDTGKPLTKTRDADSQSVHFYGHEDVSSMIAHKVLTRLRFPRHEIVRVSEMVAMHMRIGEYRSEWKDSAVKRLMHDAGRDVSDLVALAIADRKGANPKADTDDIEELERRMEQVLIKLPVYELHSPLNGAEIMELLNIPPSPTVKYAKKFLVDQIIEGRLGVDDKERAKTLLLEEFAHEKQAG